MEVVSTAARWHTCGNGAIRALTVMEFWKIQLQHGNSTMA